MFLHRHDGLGDVQPRDEYCASILLKQVWPHAGSWAMEVGMPDGGADDVEVADTVAVADAQYALSKARTVLATAVPHAPLAQSRIP